MHCQRSINDSAVDGESGAWFAVRPSCLAALHSPWTTHDGKPRLGGAAQSTEATVDTLREYRQLSCRTRGRKEMNAPAVPSSALGRYRKRAEAVLVRAVLVKLVVNAEGRRGRSW